MRSRGSGLLRDEGTQQFVGRNGRFGVRRDSPGTCRSDRYSANRAAEQPSNAHASSARNAAAGRIRPLDATAEVCGDSSTTERFLNKRLVSIRMAQQNGDTVDAIPGRRELMSPAGNLDALHCFAGRGEIGNG